MAGRLAVVVIALVLGACACPRVCCPARDGPMALGSTASMDAAVQHALAARPQEPAHVLALSGGGQNGAFASGILQGWREIGRPEFRIVTGVSIGALISTFAFLGTPEADEVTRTAFRGLDRCNVFPGRSFLDVPRHASIYRESGIKKLIRQFVTDDVIRQVAAASRGGERLLLVGTTNVDTGSLHVWDMTRIARNGRFNLFRRIMRASASVPLLLPMVEIHGAMHVDGAVTQQVFVPPLRAACDAVGRPTVTVHAIANTAIYVNRECVPHGSVTDVGTRALITLIRTQMIDNLWRMWGQAQLEGIELRMLFVPLSAAPAKGGFLAIDAGEMDRLYEAGEAAGRDPSAWSTTPPRHRMETSR